MANRPCGSRASLRVALRSEEESRPTTLALTFILGLSVVLHVTGVGDLAGAEGGGWLSLADSQKALI